jgi:hypothetical protein
VPFTDAWNAVPFLAGEDYQYFTKIDAFVLALLVVALISYYCEPETRSGDAETMVGGLDAALIGRTKNSWSRQLSDSTSDGTHHSREGTMSRSYSLDSVQSHQTHCILRTPSSGVGLDADTLIETETETDGEGDADEPCRPILLHGHGCTGTTSPVPN